MPAPEIIVWAGFRCHVLLPNDVVGTIIDDRPTWPGLEVQALEGADVYLRHDRPVLRVSKSGDMWNLHIRVEALSEVWIQEPGLSVKVAGEGTWRGFGPGGKWTSPAYSLKQRDAHRSTIHFSRVRTSDRFTVGVEYRANALSKNFQSAFRFRSDGGFAKLLDRPALPVPWRGCEVFGAGYELEGTVSGPEVLRRWELAGKAPNIGQMHFLGWTGGAGCVVNEHGRDVGAPGDRYLWNPRSWRRLRPGESISQTLRMRRL